MDIVDSVDLVDIVGDISKNQDTPNSRQYNIKVICLSNNKSYFIFILKIIIC